PEQYDYYIENYVLQPAIDGTQGGYDPGAQDFKISIKDEGQPGSFKHNEDGTIKKLLSNLRVMLQRHPKAKDLKFNEFSQEVTLKGVPVTDSFLIDLRSEEHTSELQSRFDLVCRLLLEKKNIDEN